MAAMQITDRDPAPGTMAIVTALAARYPDQTPAHWVPAEVGEEEPLAGVSCFAAEGHWHYVSYGLTQLEDDGSRFPAREGASGFGFELTFRLLRMPGESPPRWPVALLQRLARYVFRSANVFRSGDHMALNGALGDQRRTELVGVLFALDPELPPMDTRYGEVSFVQIVGATADEIEAVKDWRCEGVVDLIRERDPWLVTDMARPSWLTDPSFAAACREGARQEGSSHGSSFAPVVRWSEDAEGLVLTLSAIAVDDLIRALRLRVPYNKPFQIHGRRASVRVVPGLGADYRAAGRELLISAPWDAASAMAQTLKPKRGTYPWPGLEGLRVVVVPTDIRGPKGELVRVIG